jgi:hypothetical protein
MATRLGTCETVPRDLTPLTYVPDVCPAVALRHIVAVDDRSLGALCMSLGHRSLVFQSIYGFLPPTMWFRCQCMSGLHHNTFR